jgi:site-specific DNA-methyltransferase (adenine-specific)
MTPYYERNGITLYCGDCLEVMPQLGGPVDVVLTDPPYGDINHVKRLHERAKYKGGPIRNLHKGNGDFVGFDWDDLLGQIDTISKKWIYMFAGDKTGYVRSFFNSMDCMTRIGVWEKTNPTPLHGQYIWTSSVEICAIVRKRNADFFEFCQSPVWRFPTENTTEHPTEKPVRLFMKIIRSSAKKTDLILDPFAGSGTTGLAAQNDGRRCVMIEQSEEYCKIAVDRLRQPSFFSLPSEPAPNGHKPVNLAMEI